MKTALTVSKLWSGHNFAGESKENNSKSINARVMVLALVTSSDNYMKFQEDSLNGFEVIERTGFCDTAQG